MAASSHRVSMTLISMSGTLIWLGSRPRWWVTITLPWFLYDVLMQCEPYPPPFSKPLFYSFPHNQFVCSLFSNEFSDTMAPLVSEEWYVCSLFSIFCPFFIVPELSVHIVSLLLFCFVPTKQKSKKAFKNEKEQTYTTHLIEETYNWTLAHPRQGFLISRKMKKFVKIVHLHLSVLPWQESHIFLITGRFK